MKRMFEEVAEEFAGEQRYVHTVDAAEPESALLDRLAEVQEQFPVKVGSYPGEHVTVRFEGTEEELVEEAAAWFSERVESPTAE
jgi:hypothetical protein